MLKDDKPAFAEMIDQIPAWGESVAITTVELQKKLTGGVCNEFSPGSYHCPTLKDLCSQAFINYNANLHTQKPSLHLTIVDSTDSFTDKTTEKLN